MYVDVCVCLRFYIHLCLQMCMWWRHCLCIMQRYKILSLLLLPFLSETHKMTNVPSVDEQFYRDL